MATVDILVPTNNRLTSLIMTLSSIASQTLRDLHVIIADQSQIAVENEPVIQALRRIIEARGGQVSYYHRPPVHGIAEQRDFLLRQTASAAVLFLDDDVWMETWVVERLLNILREEQCGFVGAFPSGLSYRDDVRRHQQQVEYWDGPVHAENVLPGTPRWENPLHRAANVYHVGRALPPGTIRRYKIAWCGACALYDRAKLLAVGGFSFWSRLPRYHSGEEVLVQNLLMRRWGGCCILPAGTYFSEVPTTVLNDQGTVDGHALELLPEMIARYAPDTLNTKEADAKPV
jgi:GT2 family glycosyltransferase